MTIKRIQTGPRMSQAVIHNKTVYLAGQVAPGASVTIQTREILAGHRCAIGGGGHRQGPVVVGDHLAHRHGHLRGNERRLAGVGGAGRNPGTRHRDELTPGLRGIQD